MIRVVTGAAGFLGSRLVGRLLEADPRATVRTLDLERAAWQRLDAYGARVERVSCDITDARAVEGALEGADEVFHVAALYELGTRDPARMHAINVGGTENVLGAAAREGALAVHVSSVAALGPTGVAPRGEQHWNDDAPRSVYAATKREAHRVAQAFARRSRVRIAMPATIWGEGDPSMLGRAQHLLARAPVVPIVRPDMRLCFVHVDDCADGVARVAEHGRDGESYILCAEVLPLARWIELASGDRPRVRVPDRLLDAAAAIARRVPTSLRARSFPLRLLHEAAEMSAAVHWSFSGERARTSLGWSPRAIA